MSTSQARPSLGFGDELDDFDPTDWAKPKAQAAKPAPEETRKAAEAAGFRSREPVKAELAALTAPPQQRRRRTGRNVQFNIKARPETIEAFTRIADANDWGFGETLERATALLEREHSSR